MKINHYILSKINLFMLMLSVSSILFAYYVEYILEIKPCILCTYQRIPYYATIVCSTLYISFFKKENLKISLMTYAFLFSISFCLAMYHVGIERGIIEYGENCTVPNISHKFQTLEDIKINILGGNVSCKDVNLRILGASMSEINLLLSLGIVAYSIFYLIKKIKPTKYTKSHI